MVGPWVMLAALFLMVVGFILNSQNLAITSIIVIVLGGIVTLVESWNN